MEDINILKNYEILGKLGQGTFGSVYKVKNRSTNKVYALKQILLSGANKKEIDSVKNEAKYLSNINHKNIVNYCGSYEDGKYFNIFMEYCEGSDLKKLINDYKSHNHPIPKYMINYIFKSITNGIKEIHKNKLIHRDLKPENILITNDFDIKIGDFGISKQLNSISQYAKTQAGTLLYMAPEVISEDFYNNKVDIWSLGCILYELCSLKFCFDSNSLKTLIDKILYENPEKINTKIYGEKLEKIINLLLKKNYKERPDINELDKLLNETDIEKEEKTRFLKEKYESIMKIKNKNSFDYLNKDYSEDTYLCPYQNYKPIVIDLGTRFCRFGFASNDYCSYSIPTCIGRPKNVYNYEGNKEMIFIGKDAEDLKDDLDLIYPIKNGIFYDWDNLTNFLDFIFKKELKVNPANHLLIISENPFNTKKNREKLAEIIFENFNFPALCIENKARLNCYAEGKFNGLNIHIGESGTYIVPVFESFKLEHAMIKYDIGGQALTEYMMKLLSKANPKFLDNRFKIIAETIKEKVCFTSKYHSIYLENLKDFNDPIDYQLPDGSTIVINKPRFECPEILFEPSLINKNGKGLPLLCINSVEKCDEDIKELLLNNVFLTGGTSKMKDLKDRLFNEITANLSSSLKDKLEFRESIKDGDDHCWFGGCILGCIKQNEDIIYKKDYLKYGVSIIHNYTY